jgi:hypothetical protein
MFIISCLKNLKKPRSNLLHLRTKVTKLGHKLLLTIEWWQVISQFSRSRLSKELTRVTVKTNKLFYHNKNWSSFISLYWHSHITMNHLTFPYQVTNTMPLRMKDRIIWTQLSIQVFIIPLSLTNNRIQS